ncbi:MAG: thioredoxin family protein [Flavobacteriaceae bacterium]|nr:thioredoxin family protein [Flavobacteriaceae bacterium]MDG1965698.1 thioredoxin family protein [Flavobacteriaceae bacterium]
MARTKSYMLPLNTKAPTFSLPNPVDDTLESIDKVKGSKGTMVIFMCNHCPYVLHLLDKIVEVTNEIKTWGINTVAISSNDIVNYPDDRPELMKRLASENTFGFPYLYDETQEVALAYEAACTPDFYLFDANLKLVYRGKFDDSRPQNDIPVTGHHLLQACESLVNKKPQDTEQMPSLGCGIKWKLGNEPKGFSN